MSVLYLTNAPVPNDSAMDAHFQELELLKSRFDGEIISAFPFSRPNSLLPRMLYGRHNGHLIKKISGQVDLVHLFSPVLYPYHYIRHFKNKPLVYSTLTAIDRPRQIKNVDHFIVYDENSTQKLKNAGVDYVSCSPPLVDFKKQILPYPEGEFTLLMASAPWEKRQFESKGIHLLFSLLGRYPKMKVIFIWRNVLYEDMARLVNQSAYSDRIELVNGRIDITEYLQRAHAVILLARESSLVKSYPHSLMEGLLTGRPVITSDVIPMSDFVKSKSLGVVVNDFSIDALARETGRLIKRYKDFSTNVQALDDNIFSKEKFIDFHKQLYRGYF